MTAVGTGLFTSETNSKLNQNKTQAILKKPHRTRSDRLQATSEHGAGLMNSKQENTRSSEIEQFGKSGMKVKFSSVRSHGHNRSFICFLNSDLKHLCLTEIATSGDLSLNGCKCVPSETNEGQDHFHEENLQDSLLPTHRTGLKSLGTLYLYYLGVFIYL